MSFGFPLRYELEDNEYIKIGKLVTQVRNLLFERLHPDGFRGCFQTLSEVNYRA
jgi:hypothetical protein